MLEAIDNAAGEIWRYLDKNGTTTVSKMTKELGLDAKNIQRGIGWLAQEGKLSIEIKDRAETISLI
jgi:predicted HTH transcriptional regulator